MDRINAFLEASGSRPARRLLLDALDRLEPCRRALELGCGAGVDALALLEHGLHVTAVDVHPDAIDRVTQRASELGVDAALEARCVSFTDLSLPSGGMDLIHASFSLPFADPEAFRPLWADLGAWLRPGGRFVGQLFGDHDEWAEDDTAPASTFLSREQVDGLVAGWEVRHFEEVDRRGPTALGTEKHWHVFHMVLQKRIESA